MRCPSCGQENIKDAPVCKRCAADLRRVCPACQTRNDGSVRFCRACGEPLYAADAIVTPSTQPSLSTSAPYPSLSPSPLQMGRHELRIGTATLLFTDIERSTELLQRLGDDEARELWRTHFRLLRNAVEARGGGSADAAKPQRAGAAGGRRWSWRRPVAT